MPSRITNTLLLLLFLAASNVGHANTILNRANTFLNNEGQATFTQNTQPGHQTTNFTALASDPIWHSFLHYADDTFYIHDPKFLLSNSKPSPLAELKATIRAFQGDKKQEFICRFPGRYQWLQNKVGLPAFEFRRCPGLKEFLERAPADTVSLIFASENLTSPASSLGHLLLRIRGNTPDGQARDHAISYFTDMTEWDPVTLILNAMVIGKRGYYALKPFPEQFEHYNSVEQRNIWNFDIRLSEAERKRLVFHLYELKDIKLTYYFHSYNCSTLLNFILSLVAPSLRGDFGLWVTPLDVVKGIHRAERVAKKELFPANRWMMFLLSENLSSVHLTAIEKAILDNKLDELPHSESSKTNRLLFEMASVTTNFLAQTDRLDENRLSQVQREIRRKYGAEVANQPLNISNYKNPVDSPSDSQIEVGFNKVGESELLKTGILLAGQKLEDDNRQFYTEKAVRMLEIELSTDINTQLTRLESVHFYGVENYVPVAPIVGGISGKLNVGMLRRNDLERRPLMSFVEGGFGLTYRFAGDLDLYATTDATLAYLDSDFYGFASIHVGSIIREVFAMKTLIDFSTSYNRSNNEDVSTRLSVEQVKYLGTDFSLHLRYQHHYEAQHESDWELSLKYLF